MNSGGAASAMDNQSMDPGELLVFLKRCPARPMLPRVGPEYVPVEREGGGRQRDRQRAITGAILITTTGSAGAATE